MTKPKAPKAAKYKQDIVKRLVKMFEDAPIVGAVNMENLPADALQGMRAKLRGKADLFMTKRTLIKLALKEVEAKKPGISQLTDKLVGMPALLFTHQNPFAIYKIIKQSKSPAPAKGGQKAPKDIVVKAGMTPFLPGPIIGELGQFGIKTGVENGKISIKADKVVVKEGEEISQKLASILTRLDVKPMEIGLDITAVYEAGTIYDRKILDVDEDAFMANLQQAAVWARNLAVEAAYPAKDILPLLLGKAFRDAKAIGTEANIMVPGVMPELLAKAQRQMSGLKQSANL